MPSLCDVYTLGSFDINDEADLDYLSLGPDGLEGLDAGPEVRRTVPRKGAASGGIQLVAQLDVRDITMRGNVIIRSADPFADPTGYSAAMETLKAAAQAAAVAGLNTPQTLSWGSDSLSVLYQFIRFGGSFSQPTWMLGLLALDPTIA